MRPRSSPESRRLLRPNERDLVRALLASEGENLRLARNLENLLVEEMNDGGMGSLLFVKSAETDRRFGQKLAEASFLDEDRVAVSVTLNVDQYGDLFELDVWKVDFSPLKRIPSLHDIQIVNDSQER